MKKLFLIPILLLTLAGAITACGDSDELEVTDAWSRVTTPTQESGAVYMTIKSPEEDKLVKASVPTSIAGEAELHETVDDKSSGSDESPGHGEGHGEEHGSSTAHGDDHDSMMGMRHVDSIDIPADSEVVLEPGGFHIMLVELAKPIEDGETIPVTLTFEKAGEVQVDATARES